jgi:hypothetical protein
MLGVDDPATLKAFPIPPDVPVGPCLDRKLSQAAQTQSLL